MMFNFLLFFTLFYTFNTTCIVKCIPAEPSTVPLPPSLSSFLIEQHYDQDGFCGNTLVQTPYGYKPIKNLVKDDLVIDCNGQEKRILAITKKYVTQYVKLVVDNAIIYSGCDQRYCAFPASIWSSAKRVWAGAVLSNNNSGLCEVVHAELIYENAFLYCLTVEDHIFSIAPNGLCVHNAEALIVGVSSMCFGQVITINPIEVAIGASVALSTITHKAYQAYIQQYPNNAQKVVLPIDVVLAERSYYTQRANALETIKQEFLSIKNGLESVTALYSADSVSFTYQFLQKNNNPNAYCTNQLLKTSAKNEASLSDKQKENLRRLREINLQHLEQEIISLQCTLGLHIDELIKQMGAARDEHTTAQEQINSAIHLWNNNLSNMTYDIALPLYKANLLEEHLLNNCNQKLNELKIVAHYYNNCSNTVRIKQSTNILEVLKKLVPVITEYDQWVATEKVRVAKNIKGAEEHFAYQGVSIPHLKNEIKNALAKSRNDRNAQAIAEAKNKLLSIAVSGGPHKNNNKKDDDESNKNLSNEKNTFKTTKEATEEAEKLGFKKTNYHSQGQPVFKKGNRYISPDIDSHKGGVWKMADSVASLGSKATRMGTYDKYLNWIGK